MNKLSLSQIQAVDVFLHNFKQKYHTKEVSFPFYKMVLEVNGILLEASCFRWDNQENGRYCRLNDFSIDKDSWSSNIQSDWLSKTTCKLSDKLEKDKYKEFKELQKYPEVLLQYILDFLHDNIDDNDIPITGTPYLYDVKLVGSNVHFDSYCVNETDSFTIRSLVEVPQN